MCQWSVFVGALYPKNGGGSYNVEKERETYKTVVMNTGIERERERERERLNQLTNKQSEGDLNETLEFRLEVFRSIVCRWFVYLHAYLGTPVAQMRHLKNSGPMTTTTQHEQQQHDNNNTT